MPIVVDRTSWPLVFVTAHGSVTSADMSAYLGVVEELVGSGEHFAMHCVIESDIKADRAVVREMATWFKKNAARCAKWIGLALILKTVVARFLLSSMLLIARLPMPYEVVNSPDAGLRWLARRFRDAKLPLPAKLGGF
jgi:hypothetical protein